MANPEFKAAVGLSRKWDAREAGREVALDTLNKLGADVKPDFFLLFSTIHYEKHGGFQQLLDGVWDILPKGTPLIGGTVAGFINPQGCYTRGVTALAVNYPNMDVAVGIGHNTKRNPQKAAKECAKMIKIELDKSKFKNNFILALISGGLIPQIPGIGRKKVLTGLLGKVSIHLSNLSTILLQKGIAREDEIMIGLIKNVGDYNILGGSLMDNMNFLDNYQFLGTKILKNSMVALGIKADLGCNVSMTHGMKETKIGFEVTKLSSDKRFIHEINHKPALYEFLRLLNWPKEDVNESMYRRTFYYPLSFVRDNNKMPGVVLMFLDTSMLLSYQMQNKNVDILTTSGRDLINAVDENLEQYSDKKPCWGIIVSCATRLETLSHNIYKVREKLLNYFGEQPFLLFYTNGECTYTPTDGLKCCNETFNTAIFWSQ